LKGETINNVTSTLVNENLIIKGKSIDGLKLSYICYSGSNTNNIILDGLIKAVVMCFESEISPTEAIRKIFKNQNIF
jgi:hypothetical protein